MHALRALVVVLIGLVLATPAQAQGGVGCAWSLGVAGNLTPPGRGWDLSTPRGSWSLSPALSSQCSNVDDLARVRGWVGVDAVPTLQHRYRRIGERGTLGMLLNAGATFRLAPNLSAGPHVVTNVTAWGLGGRIVWLRPPRNRLAPSGIELRTQWMHGTNPDFQALLLFHVHHRWADAFSEERHLPEGRRSQLDRRWAVATGFEAGLILAGRAEVTLGEVGRPQVGLRAGTLTNFFVDAAVQPIGLAYLDWPLAGDDGGLQASLSGGSTRRDGAWVPVAGIAGELDPSATFLQGRVGILVGGGPRLWASADIGLGWVW